MMICEREEIQKRLPPEASITPQNELMWKDEACIASFLPNLVNLVDAVTDGFSETLLRLVCLFGDGAVSREFILKPEELERINWPALDARCLLNPDYVAAKTHLVYVIRYMMRSAPNTKEYHLTRTGLYEIEGIRLYCTGDQILWSPGTENQPQIVLDPQANRMAVDLERYSEADAFLGIAELISLTPNAGRVIEAHVITGLTQAAYTTAGVIPNSALEVVAPSGSMKTTYVPLLAQAYNRDGEIKPETRLNSSHRFIEELLHENSEFTTIIDDLHTAASSAIKRKNEEAKEEITRRIGDNTGRGRMAGNTTTQHSPRGNAIFLGEYLTGGQSTVARGLAISFDKPDPRRLQKFQREPLLISTFYHYFLEWYIENYSDIQEALAEKLEDFRNQDWGGIHLRLKTTQFCLFTGYMLFWKYALDKGFVSPSEAQYELREFWELLSGLVKSQNKRIGQDQDNAIGEVDYFELVRGWYKGGVFNLAPDGNHMHGQDGFEHKGRLCLKGEKLMKRIQRVAPAATPLDVRRSLQAHKALWVDGEGKNMRVCNQRVIGIPLKKLD